MKKDREKLWLFNLKKRSLRGNPINVHKCLKGWCEDDRARISSVMLSERTRGNGLSLKSPEHQETPFTVKKLTEVSVVEHWHRLPQEAVVSPSLDVFQSPLHIARGSPWVALLGQSGWAQQPPEIPSNLSHSAILISKPIYCNNVLNQHNVAQNLSVKLAYLYCSNNTALWSLIM